MTSNLVHRIPAMYFDESDGASYRLGTQWWFRDDDPAAFLVRCPEPRGEIVEWLFARELIAAGLRAPAGQALFHVEPCPTGDHLNVTALFASGLVTIAFPFSLVEAFLVATIALCPLGELAEGPHYVEELAAGVAEVLNDWPR